MRPTTPRVVFTGLGVVAPNGIGVDAYWTSARGGRHGIAPITRFDSKRYGIHLAGQVESFDAGDHIEQRLVVQTDRWTHMALAAAREALEDAKLDPADHDPFGMGVITASSSGGNEFGQREIQRLWANGPRSVGAYQSIAWFYAAATGQICIREQMKGPSGVVASEGAGGLDALGQAARNIRRGTETMLVGGTEAPVSPYALACHLPSGRLSRSGCPEDAYLPFDRRADGIVLGEGGAMLVTENLDVARDRGAPNMYAELCGHASTFDAHHIARPAPDGRQLARAMSLALDRAGVHPAEVDAVFADGAGIPEDDAAEAAAIRRVFGDRAVPVTVPKSMVGRMAGGGGALDVATALLSLRDGCLPPTANVGDLAEEGIDLVRGEARPLELATVLVVARGFGGFNSAVVLRRLAEDAS